MLSRTLRSIRRPAVAWPLGIAALLVAIWVIAGQVDPDVVERGARAAVSDPAGLALVGTALLLAFWMRAVAWHLVLPELTIGQAWSAILLSFSANHVLPLRLGEAVRPASAATRTPVPLSALVASTLTLRSADMLAMMALGAIGGEAVLSRVLGAWGWLVLVGVVTVAVGGLVWLLRIRAAGTTPIRLPGVRVLVLTVVAWAAEGCVVWQVARWADVSLGYREAVLVTVAAVTAQIAAIAPGGFGTYEAAATAALVALGVPAPVALAVALVTHGVKTMVSFAVAVPAAIWPAPSLLGRLRLPVILRRPPVPASPGPIVLVLPARDEAPRVASVIARLDATVAGRPTECVVVDDGSTDDTAAVARAAGATVVAHPTSLGLGAAVRTGLAEGVRRGAAVVAFCDADGEYDPAELERLVGPILSGRADYVVGSRFAGVIEHMRPHRRVGNRALTVALAWSSRQPVTDGQSGFRALSRRAASDAVINHDYNYAQVLTLDLIRRGHGYDEVPITYRFRSSGRSFVKLGQYLCRVLPAWWRVINRPADDRGNRASVHDDVGAEALTLPSPAVAVETVVA